MFGLNFFGNKGEDRWEEEDKISYDISSEK